jgi:hypothetical protein
VRPTANATERARRRAARQQRGAALLITTVLLILMGLLGLAALETTESDQQVAGFQNRRDVALYAAEAGLAKGFETLTTTRTPSIPTTSVADGSVFPHGQPEYRADPSVADPIDSIGNGAFPGTAINIDQGGAPTYMLRYWRIRSQGEEPGGGVARVEAVAGALIAN